MYKCVHLVKWKACHVADVYKETRVFFTENLPSLTLFRFVQEIFSYEHVSVRV